MTSIERLPGSGDLRRQEDVLLAGNLAACVSGIDKIRSFFLTGVVFLSALYVYLQLPILKNTGIMK
jgi:hypothetical protein